MYIELSYAEFEKEFPLIAKDFEKMCSYEALKDFRTDPNYIVRINENGVEIGYRSDSWHIVA